MAAYRIRPARPPRARSAQWQSHGPIKWVAILRRGTRPGGCVGRGISHLRWARHNPWVPELSPGAEFAGCRIEAVAGRGGMGVVYRATELSLGRPVALKLLAPDRARDEEFRERFQRESRMAAAIDHPNVIPVYAAGEHDGSLYLV